MEHNPIYTVISMLINYIGIKDFYYPEHCQCLCDLECKLKFK